jgi:hypothetical protein
MLSQLRSGALECFALSGVNVLSTLIPTSSIYGLGFAFPNYDAVWRAMDGQLGPPERSCESMSLWPPSWLLGNSCSSTRPPVRSRIVVDLRARLRLPELRRGVAGDGRAARPDPARADREGREQRGPQGAHRHPDLEALEVLRLADRPHAVGDLAELSTLIPTSSIYGLGFAFPNYDAVWRAMDGQLGQTLRGLEALEVLRLADRPHAVGDLAEAVVPDPVQHHEAARA